MADPDSGDELFTMWRKQVEAGAQAWSKAVQEMANQGQVPHAPPDPTFFWKQFTDAEGAPWAQFQGAGPVDPEILAKWKKFLDEWIAAWSKALEEAMGTEAFAEALGKTLNQFLTVQAKAKQAATRSSKATIDALGLPSRDQVIGLARQMMDLEDRLESIQDKLDAKSGAAPRKASAPRPASTKKKPRARAKTAKTATATKRRAKTVRQRKKGKP